MSRTLCYVRASFIEVFRVLSGVSLRSWILLFLGPMYAFFGTWTGGVSTTVRMASAAPLVALVIWSAVADIVKRPAGTWITKAVMAWVILFIAMTIVIIPKYDLHDELLLTEAGLQKISGGVDPYGADYRGTIVDQWYGHSTHESYVNGVYPAWDHYVYLPGFFVASLPFYVVLHGITGWYDQRLIYLLAYAGILVGAWTQLKRSPIREPLTLILALNPFLTTASYGFNDLLPVMLLMMTGLAFARQRTYLAAAVYGLALATKQTMLLTVPFLLPVFIAKARIASRSLVRTACTVVGVAVAVVLPFFLWSPWHMYDDTMRFFFGSAAYPISGEGISSLLLMTGVVRADQYVPFWLLQLLIAVPLMVVLWRWAKRQPSLTGPFLGATGAICLLWFFSRYFLPAHAYVIILLIIISFVIGEVQRTHETS